MKTPFFLFLMAISLLVANSTPALAGGGEGGNKTDFIMHHVVNGKTIDLEPFTTIHLPTWEPIRIGSFELDLSPTKHSVFLWLNSLIVLILGITAGAAYRKRPDGYFAPKGLGNLMELLVEFIRNDIAIPMIGEHAYKKFMPYLLSVFFFILVSNYMGLMPYGAAITGDINVTAALALCTFFIIHFSAKKTYWQHIFTPHVPLALYPIMVPVEILGMFTKPFALAVRLFANMSGGHLVILTFIGLIFIIGTYAVAPIAILLAVFIYMIKVLVCLIQAYVFTLLSAAFIGMAVEEPAPHH